MQYLMRSCFLCLVWDMCQIFSICHISRIYWGCSKSVDSKKQYKHFLIARLTRLLSLPLQTKKKNKKSSTNNRVKFISHSHMHTQNITIAYLLLCIDLLEICLHVNKSFCNFFKKFKIPFTSHIKDFSSQINSISTAHANYDNLVNMDL